MKTPREILKAYGVHHHDDEIERDDAECAMREYALEVLQEITDNIGYYTTGEGYTGIDKERIKKLKQEINGQ